MQIQLENSIFATKTFEEIMALSGEVYRQQPGRRTLCYQYQGQRYFAKLHFGVGWQEIIKNLVYGRLPILGAEPEWQALQYLPQLDIAVPELVAYGKRGWNPARQQSFVITKALETTISLEELGQLWQQQPPVFSFKWRLIKAVAEIANRLHQNGVNHRDFYLCHFLLEKRSLTYWQNMKLYLIDLHRVQIRPITPQRWRIKDLSGLWFSAMDCGLTRRDLLRFIKYYYPGNWREMLYDQHFWQQIRGRAVKLYYKSFQKWPALS
jgi:heptose I phosphotransferase